MIFYDNMNSITDIFCAEWIIISLVLALFITAIILIISKKFMQIVQQSGYSVVEFGKWLSRKGNVFTSRLLVLFLLSTLAFLLFNVAFIFVEQEFVCYLGFLFMVLFVVFYVLGDKKHENKCPIKYTARMKRQYITLAIITFVFSLALLLLINVFGFILKDNELFLRLRLVFMMLIIVFTPLIVSLSTLLNKPFENINNERYVKACTKKLESSNVIKIAITGSYAKTSVKNILKTILSEKYRVEATPGSYNTPMGISKAVNEMRNDAEIFIAEMGARKRGDIKKLCQIVKPNHAIITGITHQHIETFKTLEQVKKTKFELVEAIDGGIIALQYDDENSKSFLDKNSKANFVLGGESGGNVYAKDVLLSKTGCSFTLVVDNQHIGVNTKLIGKHNVSNICLASALCYKLGLTLQQIACGISKIEYTPHRLEIVENQKNITIIDDSFNANVVGSRCALETLKLFEGKKIIVTPGLVELGSLEKTENIAFGKAIADVCDKVVLVGIYTAYHVRKGLLDAGYSFDDIIMVKELEEAKEKLNELIEPGAVVLFENDLPDKYN